MKPSPNGLGSRFALVYLALVLLTGVGCAHRPKTGAGVEPAVREVLASQLAAWNRGDIAGFMEGYARGEGTRFASGGEITLGWQTVFDRYQRRYGTREAMGQLVFSNVQVEVLSSESAMVFGQWQLLRTNDRPSGLFTLLFRRTDAGWRVVHDHTSSATP